MTNPIDGLKQAQEWHRAGQLKQAKDAYLALLQAKPDDATVMHLLALLYAEEGLYDSAQALLEKAIELNPDALGYSLHLANILKVKGCFSEASDVLRKLIQQHPSFVPAYNNLGTVSFAQGRWSDAISAYRAAIDLQPDYIDAYYNLGLALIKEKLRDEAITVYRALLELAPHHPGGHFQLGCLLMQQNQYRVAADHFALIEREHPFHFETQSNLASCYLRLGYLNDAKTHYVKALEMMPMDVQVLFNLGVISMQQGKVREAIEYYSRANQINADMFEVHNNLGAAFFSVGDSGRALHHFREALRLQPGNEAIKQTIQVLTKDKQLSVSPPEYVRTLFDSYADHYDAHIASGLHYQVPQLFYQAISATADLSNARWDILDLGCGTGLCGEYFRSVASSLIGVDLSNNMLEIAKQKRIYDDLIQTDMLAYLRAKKAEFDLILAGDVLVYVGDLDQLFSAVYVALRRQGLFVFNVEQSDQEGYGVTDTGRFAHNRQYVDVLISQHGFDIVSCQTAVLRMQQQQPVPGYIYLLRKVSSLVAENGSGSEVVNS